MARPTHRLVMHHDPENDKNYTEVGAMWKHKTGGGFGITIKEGLSLATFKGGARLTAFRIDDDEERGDERRGEPRGGKGDRGRERSRGRSRDDDDGPPPPSDDDAPANERGGRRGGGRNRKNDDDIPF